MTVASVQLTSQLDALDFLATDHRDVQALFQQFEAMDDRSGADRKILAERICQALTLNIQIEERVFYPTLREFVDARELLHEAEIEHAAAKQLIVQIHRLNADDELYAAKLKELAQHIDRHVRIEEQGMFPQVRASGLDLVELGVQLSEAKELAAEGLTA